MNHHGVHRGAALVELALPGKVIIPRLGVKIDNPRDIRANRSSVDVWKESRPLGPIARRS